MARHRCSTGTTGRALLPVGPTVAWVVTEAAAATVVTEAAAAAAAAGGITAGGAVTAGTATTGLATTAGTVGATVTRTMTSTAAHAWGQSVGAMRCVARGCVVLRLVLCVGGWVGEC